MHKHPSFVRLGLIALALVTLAYTYSARWSPETAVASELKYQTYSPLQGPRFPTETPLRLAVADVDLLGMTSFPTGFESDGTEVGGLSGLVYNRSNGFYTALSDDRSQRNPARFYSLTIDLGDGRLNDGDVVFTGLVTMENENEEPFAVDSIDPEGIALTNNFRTFISSEGNVNANPPVAPFIREFSFVGAQIAELPLPGKYLPQADGSAGIRNNLAFESLTISRDQRYLYTAVENALAQDGPVASLTEGSPARILQYDLATGTPIHEYVYMVEAIPQDSDPAGGVADNGLVDLQPLDNNGTFLAMERSYAEGVGNTIRLYQITTRGARDVLALESLQTAGELDGEVFDVERDAVHKELLIDLAELGIQPDNVEGMVFGPLLPDGRQALILVSDNNFNESQSTQFIALGLSFEATALVAPTAETTQLLDVDPVSTTLPEGSIIGRASDPAIWVHPTEPERSLIFAALQEGGLAIIGLNGNVLAAIPPDPYGSASYANLDILYDFTLNGEVIDLIVATDSINDSLVFFAFEPTERTIENVTGEEMMRNIFGVDEGVATAHGLTVYSDAAGAAHAFVGQNGGQQVAQFALIDMGNGRVNGELVQTWSMPTMPADATPAVEQGLVVDRELGYLYVVAADGMQIQKYRVDESGEERPMPVRTFHGDEAQSPMSGLAIYYGAMGEGYLLASVPGTDSYALFERTGDNSYLGTFAIGELIGEERTIDQLNSSSGLAATNVALGDQYPSGLLVVQDAVDMGLDGFIGTNFKLVAWEDVAAGLAQPLLVDPSGYQPR